MKPECSSSDIISSLPQDIIETILCLVPIIYAVRTSILSKKWRYSWTRIPKLVFSEEDLYRGEDLLQVFCVIHQVLLMHQGSIFEFSLSMYADNTYADIDQIITYLSRKNTVEKLKLELNLDIDDGEERYKLPLSFFSFLHLTHLHLEHCNLDHQQPTLNGFGQQLTSLFLNNVDISEKLILHVVSKSPLLKRFGLVINHTEYELSYIYSLAFICELFGNMPSVEHLFLDIEDLHILDASNSCLPKLPTPLVHLKYAYFVGGCDLPFPVSLLRSSPNLEKLKLQELEVDFDTDIDEMKMELLKLILGRSPMLKVVNIGINSSTIGNHDAEILRVLSDIPRASEMVKIVVKRSPDSPTPDDSDEEV
ncbi:F-box/FBD/LRR-repeat protein At1g13570-like [Rutidosis leptorrhynchoides]|uniref:F-box/FBD/LRR-repeat protein At1g13570-like n=1 Tax=Rutidosis leptorrhynchoides TaxID=125765 RepID=UPI003A99AAE8